MATFMAETLFATSDLGQPAAAKKDAHGAFCDNIELCKITEDLVFTDPWRVAAANRWTSPQLDVTAAAVRADGPWKRAAQEYKLKFLSEAQALIHGDLHTGSIMVTEDETRVIDPEFAFYGPMGFDVGALAGQFLPRLLRPSGHEAGPARATTTATGSCRPPSRSGPCSTGASARCGTAGTAARPSRPACLPTAPGRPPSRRRRTPICAACSERRWASPAAR